MKRLALTVMLVLMTGLMAAPLIAQDSNQADKSALLQFVEGQLSTPERQISINGLEGVISSDVAAASITVSDQDGVYLSINNVKLNWNQAALLTGHLQINSLTADSIDYERNAHPAEGFTPPPPEAGTLELPEFPVAIAIDKLDVPSISFGEDVFGLKSEISVNGRLRLEGGSLDTALDIERLDGPGGSLNLDAKYAAGDKTLDLDLSLAEPDDGVLANLLQIEGRPDISLKIAGSGKLDDLGVDLSLDAGGERALAGTGTLSRAADGFDIQADLGGPIAELVPPAYRAFFGADTSLTAAAKIPDTGGIELNSLHLSGGQLDLTASARTADDGFLTSLKMDGKIAAAEGGPVTLPVAGAGTIIKSASFNVDYGGGANWTGGLEIAGFDTPSLGADKVRLTANGAAMNLSDSATRRVTFNADGQVTGIHAPDPEVANAFGETLGIGLAGLWNAGDPLEIAEARVAGKAFDARLSGTVEDFGFNGDVSLTTDSIAPFSGLASRDLAGSVALNAKGTLSPLTGGFDLALDGTANGLRLDIPAIDGLLSARTTLSGRIGRDGDGLHAQEFEIASDNSRIDADGSFSSTDASFTFGVAVTDLSKLDDSLGGSLNATGTAKGSDGDIALAFDAAIPSGELVDRALTNASFGFDGHLKDGDLNGNLKGDAYLDGQRVLLTSGLAVNADGNALRGLDFRAGATRLAGDLIQDEDGLLTGKLTLNSNDISTAAALALVEAKGAANGSVSLSHDGGTQSADISLSLRDLNAFDAAAGSADLKAAVSDLFGVPQVQGNASASNVKLAGISAETLSASARTDGQQTRFDGKAHLDNGTDLALSGALAAVGDGYRIGLETAKLTQGTLTAALSKPASLTVANDQIRFDGLDFAVGDGSIRASGSSGETLDINVSLDALPLSVVNAVNPGLGLSGAINGTVNVAGTAARPSAAFQLSGSGLNGTLISQYGLGPVSIDANGTYTDGIVRIASVDASGRGGLSATASGPVALTGSGSNLAVSGSVPLSLANIYLAGRGTIVSGTASLNAKLTGSLAHPLVSGTIGAEGADITDPATRLHLTGVALNAGLSANRVSISRFSANLAAGGSVSASGTVGFEGAFPADLNIALNSARYADGSLFVATASGDLKLSGPLLNGPKLTGRVQVESADISIPDFGSATVAVSSVDHVATPPDVARTLVLAKGDTGSSGGGGSGSNLKLNVLVSAPNRIFIRGDGLTAEVGGSVRLTGTASNIQPAGGFQLIRGRLEILGQQLDFTEGQVTLVGDLDPYVDLTARTSAQGTDVLVNVSGPVSAPKVTFTSQPELPQDEILSLLLFKRGTADLSPLQLAKLANAAAELAGGTSIIGNLRNVIGLDQLDIVTNEQGNAAVEAGTYIQDNVYLSVQSDAQGDNRVSIDLDLTDNLKARGSANANGETSIGIFYEGDY